MDWIKRKVKNIKKSIPQIIWITSYSTINLLIQYFKISPVNLFAFMFLFALGLLLMECYNAWPARRTHIILCGLNNVYLFLKHRIK